MTEETLKQGYFELIKRHTNNFGDIMELEKAPLPVQIAVERLIEYGKRDATVASESIADLSTTYRDLTGFPPDVKSLLSPYYKLGF